jgi:uncharacterized damage-inducible protein DinB
MDKCFAFALILATAQAQDNPNRSNPVADAARVWLQVEGANLIAAAEQMPADKYEFRPTPPQMTFAHLMAHVVESNRMMCSGIAGDAPPKNPGVPDTDSKDKLLAEVKGSFDYCTAALGKLDDSGLGEDILLFKRTRANLLMFLVADLADHYCTAAVYLRLNGLTPPTVRPKK